MMQGRYGRAKSFTPDTNQPTGIDWLGRLKGLLEIRFDDPTTDQTLDVCLGAAIAHIENLTGRVIRVGTIAVSYECWVGKFPLPFLPMLAFTGVEDLDGVDITYTRKGQLLDMVAADGCVITYTAGYGDTCPEPLQLAVLKTALTNYELRSNIAIGTISSVLPNSAEDLAASYILDQES
jgi:hypothetical protein